MKGLLNRLVTPLILGTTALLVWWFCDAVSVDNIGVRIVAMQLAVGALLWVRYGRDIWEREQARRSTKGLRQ